MFGGGHTNSFFPISMDNMRFPYNTNAVPPTQLDVLIGCNTDVMELAGNNTASLLNLPMKVGKGTPVYYQHELPVTMHDNICLNGGGRAKSMMKTFPVCTGLKLSYGEEDHNSSVSSAGENIMLICPSMLQHSDNMRTEFVRQNDEFDQYIRVQEENFRKGITELKRQHTIFLLDALEKEVGSKLRERDMEIQNLNCRNEELAEKIKQIAVEAQSWHDIAKQNESVVGVLRSKINQVVLQGAAFLKEGYGESMIDGAISSRNHNPVDHVTSLEHPPPKNEPMNCKACSGKELSVLLLPCRHLCLCIDCEAFTNSCPVCGVKKTGSLQVCMS